MFACSKNKALQLQCVPILSILGYNIVSLAASGLTLLVLGLRQFVSGPVYTGHEPPALPSLRKGGKFDHRPERPKVLLRHCVIRAVVVDTGTALPAACDDANIVDYWYQSCTVSHVNVRMLGPRVPYSLPQEHMVPICSAAYGYPLERHCVAHLSTVSSGSVTRGPLTSGVVAESSKQPRYMY